MKKTSLLLAAFFAFANASVAQSPVITWTTSIPLAQTGQLTDMVKDASHNTVMLRSEVIFLSGGSQLVKLSDAGTILFTASTPVLGRSLVLDNATESIYVTGSLFNTSANKQVFCVEKYNSSLVLQWRRSLDFTYGLNNANAEALKGVFSNGFLFVTGYANTSSNGTVEDWTVAKISAGGAWALNFKKILRPGNGRPTDCGITATGFYVCGTNEEAGRAQSGLLIKFDNNFNFIWTRLSDETVSSVNNDGWNDMEIVGSNIFIAGFGTLTVPKANWKQLNEMGTTLAHAVYNTGSTAPGNAVKITVNSGFVYLGVQKTVVSFGINTQEAHAVKYTGTTVSWDLPVTGIGPLGTCAFNNSFITDISVSNTSFLFIAGSVNDCTSGFHVNDPMVLKVNKNTGVIQWSDFTQSSSTPAFRSEQGRKIFALNDNECITGGFRFQPNPGNNIFARRYNTSAPRFAANYSHNQSISLYPNPASDKIYFNGLTHSMHVRMMDLTGKIVREKTIAGQEEIDVSDLAKGTYVIQCAEENGTPFRQTLIIQ